MGSLVGTMILTYFADIYGRRITMNIGWIITTIACFIKVFSPNIGFIIFANFFDGFGAYSSNAITIMVMSEIANGKFRKITSGFITIGFTLCPIYIMILSYYLNYN